MCIQCYMLWVMAPKTHKIFDRNMQPQLFLLMCVYMFLGAHFIRSQAEAKLFSRITFHKLLTYCWCCLLFLHPQKLLSKGTPLNPLIWTLKIYIQAWKCSYTMAQEKKTATKLNDDFCVLKFHIFMKTKSCI